MQNNFKVTRAQLQEIYPQVCQHWQNRIKQVLEGNLFGDQFEVGPHLIQEARKQANADQEAWLNRVFPKPVLSVGKWYKHTFKMGLRQEDGYMLFLFEGKFGVGVVKGFYHTASGGGYAEDISIYEERIGDYIPATSEEILDAFRKEAQKRGLVPTVDVLCLEDGDRFTIVSNHPMQPRFLIKYNEFWLTGSSYCTDAEGVCVYKDGVWADPYQECVPEGSEMENTCNEELVDPNFTSAIAKLTKVAEESGWDRKGISDCMTGSTKDPENLSWPEMNTLIDPRNGLRIENVEMEDAFIEKFKPKEPTYRPFTYEEAVDQLLGKAIKHKSLKRAGIVTLVNSSGVRKRSYKYLLDTYTFVDGSPVGVKEN